MRSLALVILAVTIGACGVAPAPSVPERSNDRCGDGTAA
jgi:hypothetical protein